MTKSRSKSSILGLSRFPGPILRREKGGNFGPATGRQIGDLIQVFSQNHGTHRRCQMSAEAPALSYGQDMGGAEINGKMIKVNGAAVCEHV